MNMIDNTSSLTKNHTEIQMAKVRIYRQTKVSERHQDRHIRSIRAYQALEYSTDQRLLRLSQ